MSPVSDAIRHQLQAIARRKKARDTLWSPVRPNDWRPTEVINPRDGQPFTPAGAWEYIAELLETHPIDEMELDQPAGKTGYVMKVASPDGEIYIKLQLGSGKIIGRSFHYSTRDI
jgi:hypothetical protein